MGPLFIPPLILKIKDIDFNLKKVRRLYFQFYFDMEAGKNSFRLRAYAIAKKRKLDESYPPIELEIDIENTKEDQSKDYFPQSASQLILGQLELSNVQIKRLIKDGSSDFLRFSPREMKINPICIVYDVANVSLASTIETANPCPPARPPADDAGDT